MRVVQVFRALLIADLLLTAPSIFGALKGPEAAVDSSSDLIAAVIAGLLILGLWVAALVGLWRFRNWARVLYLGLLVVGIVGTFLFGGKQVSPVEDALNSLCWFASGGIIALAYWSSLSSNFRGDVRAA